MKWNLDDPAGHNGLVVIGFSGGDPTGAPCHVGPMRGYMPQPTVLIEVAPGSVVHWAQSLCRLATPEEAIDYWRRRAEAAEVELRGMKP